MVPLIVSSYSCFLGKSMVRGDRFSLCTLAGRSIFSIRIAVQYSLESHACSLPSPLCRVCYQEEKVDEQSELAIHMTTPEPCHVDFLWPYTRKQPQDCTSKVG
ncbi:MAG: hypothetical protein CSA33_02790 [Desulfobulbus propionicus]|nr:MAG: hypothetical protein CSA33_02790 [Desulfobulbus propionicus]